MPADNQMLTASALHEPTFSVSPEWDRRCLAEPLTLSTGISHTSARRFHTMLSDGSLACSATGSNHRGAPAQPTDDAEITVEPAIRLAIAGPDRCHHQSRRGPDECNLDSSA